MAEFDERALVERTRNGDRQAFGDLVDAHGPVIYNLALRMTGNPEDARDLSQTTFVKAWQRLESFRGESRFFSWLYRIAIHEVLNFRRGSGRTAELDETEPSREPGPAETYERNEEITGVQTALLQLRDEDREIIVLRHFLALSHVEIGNLLHVPDKTVKSRLHTAVLRLEAVLRRAGFGHE